jgi:hypothetical protein
VSTRCQVLRRSVPRWQRDEDSAFGFSRHRHSGTRHCSMWAGPGRCGPVQFDRSRRGESRSVEAKPARIVAGLARSNSNRLGSDRSGSGTSPALMSLDLRDFVSKSR